MSRNNLNVIRKEEKIEKFLRILKENPEDVDKQIIRAEYKNLIDTAILNAKRNSNYWLSDVLPTLIKLNIIDKSDKDWYKELLNECFKAGESNPKFATIIPELIKLNIIDKSDKEWYKELLDKAFEIIQLQSNNNWRSWGIPEMLRLNVLDKSDKEWIDRIWPMIIEKSKGNLYWATYIFPEILKLDIIEKNEIEQRYKELLDISSEKMWSNWGEYAVLELFKLDIIEKGELKVKYNQLLHMAFERSESNAHLVNTIIPELLNLDILDKDEIKLEYGRLLKQIIDKVFEKAKIDISWAVYGIPELLSLDIIDKNEVKAQYTELLNHGFNAAKSISYLTAHDIPKLIKLNIIDKDDIEWYKDLLNRAFENAKSNISWAEYVIPELIKLNIIDKNDKEWYKDLLNKAFENAKLYRYSESNHWAIHVIPELIKLNIIDKDDREWYKDLLSHAFQNVKIDKCWAEYIIPELIKLNIIDKNDKERYKRLLDVAFQKAKFDENWAGYVVPELLKLDIIGKNEVKTQFRKLLFNAFENTKSDKNWLVLGIPELLKLDIIDRNEIKIQFKEILSVAFQKANETRFWAKNIIPKLLELNIIEIGGTDADIPKNITLGSTRFISENACTVEDVEFLKNSDEYFSRKEVDHLYKLKYGGFKEIKEAVKGKDYQKIWELKKGFYFEEERGEQWKVQKMLDYFGEGVWTYFVDKVPGDKLMKNRFRDPHNALLHITELISLAKQLETRGVSKEEFIKNYLGVAGDRNNGYQQLNDFLEKYKFNWKELVEGAIEMDVFKKNTEFINLARGVLEQERTGGLYKNIDSMEQILTLLHMIRNKAALESLQRLAESEDPKDKILYEYYKGAVYHPRTKPIIMEMYEDPGGFLGLDDTTFGDLEEIHQAKKPSNMVENFEFLDFEAKDLVDCLPLGIYDKLSYFKPFEMKFYISGSEVYTKQEIREKIKDFLRGAEQKRISVIVTKIKEQGDETMWFKEWKANKEEFVEKLLGEYQVEELINMFVSLGYSEFNRYRGLKEMTAKISPKSDPNNWFNGFNCDSLAEGHGKKVVAMFNPYCTDFCIYEGDQDPKEDNLKVTSWVTLNRAIPVNFSSLLSKIQAQTTKDVATVLGEKFEEYKDPEEYVITMDNIEANPNFGRKNEIAVRKIYEKFFSEYVRQNPISPNGIPINTRKFYSGVGYNKLNILTEMVENESLPVFVNAYTDNSAAYSFKGELEGGEQREKEKKRGIYPLSIEDVVQISYMEGKIYPSSMKDHLGNLQHEITASILNNTLKGRPNLSFAWYNDEGKIGGYILAYQGKMEDGTPGVYISDFAMEEKERGASGLKMIHHWMDIVKGNYPDMPIFTRAREDTSYRMIKAFAEKRGYEISKDDLIKDGGENWHRVVMEPKG